MCFENWPLFNIKVFIPVQQHQILPTAKGVGLVARVRVGQCLQTSVLVPALAPPGRALEAGPPEVRGSAHQIRDKFTSVIKHDPPVMPGEVG